MASRARALAIPSPVHPELGGAGMSRRCPQAVQRHPCFPWVQLFQRQNKVWTASTTLRDGANKVIYVTKELFGMCLVFFLTRLLGFGSLKAELAQGKLFHGLLGKTKCGTMGFIRQRPVQSPVCWKHSRDAPGAGRRRYQGQGVFSVTSPHMNS